MSDSANYGISGVQNINAQNIAVGANSRIEQSNWSDPLGSPLADLQHAIEAFQGSPASREALIATQAEIVEELKAPSPDKSKLLAKVASISHLAGPAAAIVQATAVLAQAIATVL